ncbi:hypothetical protein G9H71_11865 [Motilibacter sp. E257]|uniref:Uncharacterized protein n=1 Tax=Motilibacter deserti TaxID=2714956 RepID=A0ABX0GXQ2_9ACTN|nr:hypothetical protein [Motilibacter deserti]
MDESKITPGLTGFLLFVLLGVALWLLIRSMNRHLRRVTFEEKSPGATSAEPAPPARGPGPQGPGRPAPRA